jgi:hypothetical protein
MESQASIGYGFKITDKKLARRLDQGDQELKSDFDIMFHGDSYDDNQKTFICVDASLQRNFSFEGPLSINFKKLNVKPNWDEKLNIYAKELGIKNPKIGWWLCSSV